MKIQNIVIVFIVILIPIILIFTYYLNLEESTIKMQTNLDEKLIEATKEAVETYEINTTELNTEYSTLADAKKRDISSSINTFKTSLESKTTISGVLTRNLLDYIPAMVYVMYDGYYIYTPTYIPEPLVNENGVQLFLYNDEQIAQPTQIINGEVIEGIPLYKTNSGTSTTNIENAKKIYKHILKTFVPYTAEYNENGRKYIINYTLDNYIRIIGENVQKEGYILDDLDSLESDILYNPTSFLEKLDENVAYRDDIDNEIVVGNFKYIYNSEGEKRYYDPSSSSFFIVDVNNVRQFLPETYAGTASAEYKKFTYIDSNHQDYTTVYQLLNKDPDNPALHKWYESDFTECETGGPWWINIDDDCSAYNFYAEAYCFNNWLDDSSNRINKQNLLNNREDNIINNINNNLNLSIANYKSASGNKDFKLPRISEADWEQALSNISVITFLQGVKIGLKTYNNYAVVTSEENHDFIREELLYIIENNTHCYHKYGCGSDSNDISNDMIYKNTDFKPQSYYTKNEDDEDVVVYYYKHSFTTDGESYSYMPCNVCIISSNNFEPSDEFLNKYKIKYRNAFARERYVIMERINLFDNV